MGLPCRNQSDVSLAVLDACECAIDRNRYSGRRKNRQQSKFEANSFRRMSRLMGEVRWKRTAAKTVRKARTGEEFAARKAVERARRKCPVISRPSGYSPGPAMKTVVRY